MNLLRMIQILGGSKMANILSMVESISRGTAKSGRKYWSIKLDSGDTLFCWDFNRIADIKVNQEADFTIQEKNGFLHVLSAMPVIQEGGEASREEEVPFDSPDAPAEKPIEGSARSYGRNKDKEIRTQAMIKAACEAINGIPFEIFHEMAAGSKDEAIAMRVAAIISMVKTFEEQLF